MNILVLSWRDPKHPLAGGAEQVMHEHMKGWIGNGWNVTLLSSRIKGISDVEVIDGIKVVRRGYQYLGVQIAGIAYYLQNRNKYDFVVDQFHGIPFFAPLYVKKPILAVIQEPAGGVWFKNPLPFPMNWIVGFLGFIIEPFIFFLYKKTVFMTGSQSAKEELISYGIPGKNVNVIPHGVIGPGKKTSNSKNVNPTITFLGVLSKDKGIEDAVACFSILKKKSGYQFWVIGKPETEGYFRKIRGMVEKSGLKARIKFWGRVSDDKKFELLGKSWILINPSYKEGWGLVNVEANLTGTPVVAYKSPGLTDSVKNEISGLIVESNSPENLAEAVINLVSDSDRLGRLRQGSLAWSKRFDWDKSRRLSAELVESLLKRE